MTPDTFYVPATITQARAILAAQWFDGEAHETFGGAVNAAMAKDRMLPAVVVVRGVGERLRTPGWWRVGGAMVVRAMIPAPGLRVNEHHHLKYNQDAWQELAKGGR